MVMLLKQKPQKFKAFWAYSNCGKEYPFKTKKRLL